jgi:hypothetical protein
MAVVMLIFAGATNVFPSFKVDEGCLMPKSKSGRDKEIKEHVEDAARREQNGEQEDEEEKACNK